MVKPLVKEMDEKSHLEKSIRDGCFENGFMAAEVVEKYGGPEASFFDVAIIVEELAKVKVTAEAWRCNLTDAENVLVCKVVWQFVLTIFLDRNIRKSDFGLGLMSGIHCRSIRQWPSLLMCRIRLWHR